MMKEILNYDGQLFLYDNFLSNINFGTDLLNQLKSEISWRTDTIKMYGKTHPLPRLTAWYGTPGISYSYSKITMVASGWTPTLEKINFKLAQDLDLCFNSVLVNYYRNGLDHMSYHSDDEKELGRNPTIASISIGETRKFVLKHKFNSKIKPFEIFLKDRSLLIMSGELQHYWNHKITKSTTILNPRINLTFRNIIS